MTTKLPPETEEELQFVKQHRNLSAASSGLFAAAGATFIGILGKLTSDFLGAAQKISDLHQKITDEKRLPTPKEQQSLQMRNNLPKGKLYWGIVGGLAAFGAVCMFLSNWLESKKTVLEWQLGGNKISRKMQMAENKTAPETASPPAQEPAPAIKEEPPAQETTQWRDKREGEKKELAMAGAGERGRA